MKLADPVVHDLLARLRRIEGQARGVQRMIEDGRDCTEIVRQVSAMRAALAKVAMGVVSENLEECLRRGLTPEEEPELRRAKQAFLDFV